MNEVGQTAAETFAFDLANKYTMKEAVILAGPKVKIVQSSVPQPGPDEVLIKVAIAAASPKDW